MLSGVLNSQRPVQLNEDFEVVFAAIRELIGRPRKRAKQIGFRPAALR